MPSTPTQDRTELLPSDALRGKSLGISVSESPDLSRLGLFEDQLKMTLGELTRAVTVAGVRCTTAATCAKTVTPVS
jgi:hypothetical protein